MASIRNRSRVVKWLAVGVLVLVSVGAFAAFGPLRPESEPKPSVAPLSFFADDTASLTREVDELQDEIRRLKSRVSDLESQNECIVRWATLGSRLSDLSLCS